MLGKWRLSSWENDAYYACLQDSAKLHSGFHYVNPVTDSTGHQSFVDKGADLLTNESIEFMRENMDTNIFDSLAIILKRKITSIIF